MKALINSTLFYFLFPICCSLILVFIFFHIPDNFYYSLLALLFVVVSTTLLVKLLIPLRMKIDCSFELMLKKKNIEK
jgi:hypothetical protein